MIRIVLVDDESSVRQGLRMRLELTRETVVVGETGDGLAALNLIRELLPDVVVMDIELSGQDGLAVTRRLCADEAHAAIVIHSMHDDELTRERASAAGAFAFVGKHEGVAALLNAIRRAAARRAIDPLLPQPMQEFYTDYYAVVEHSRAHAAFCNYAYGKNLCQHGFVTMEQLAKLIQVTELSAAHQALDLGCGNGMIAEHLSDTTGARVTGLDNIGSAIVRAEERTDARRTRLDFCLGDLQQPDFPPASFDTLLSLDSIYFTGDLVKTLQHWRALVKPGGSMAIFYSHGATPENPKETFRRETLPADKTPLADALVRSELGFATWDFTRQDHELAQRKREILEKLKPEFQAEGNLFLYENRMGEALGVLDAVESGMHARYLYCVQV